MCLFTQKVMGKSDDEQYLQTSVPSVIRKGLSGLIGITSFGNAEKKGKAFDCDFAMVVVL